MSMAMGMAWMSQTRSVSGRSSRPLLVCCLRARVIVRLVVCFFVCLVVCLLCVVFRVFAGLESSEF